MDEHYILKNAVVSDGLRFILEDAAIEIRNGKILKIAKHSEIRDTKLKTIDLGGRLVLPGLLNPHHHLYSALATGLAPLGATDTFNRILEKLWWPLDRSLDEESIYYSALSGLMQSLRYGVTAVIDHHASMHAVSGSLGILAKAFRTMGMKGLLCYEVSDREGEAALDAQIEENLLFREKHKTDPDIRGLFGMHANFTLSEKSMRRIAEAKPQDMPLHIHCGEAAGDLAFCRELGYAGPVDRLRAFGLLSRHSLLAHCIHLSDRDYDILYEIQPVVISNPESNANNNVGMMNSGKIGRYVLGTDGMTGNILGTFRSHFLFRNAVLPNPADLLFAYPAEIMQHYFPAWGRIESGAAADLAVTNYRPVTPLNPDNLFFHLIFGVQGKEMFMTVANGKILFSDNTLHTVDETAINAEIKKTVKKLYERYQQ